MGNHFTHLHLHTEYSLLDGAIRLEQLIDFGKKQGLKALAITDHGNIFGAVKFFELCKKEKIKPILGMEAYFTETVNDKSVDNKYYHLILIVKNEIGYKNLCKLIAFSFKEGFYFKPRIDYEILEKYSEGLIITTACLGGHIPKLLMTNQEEEAEKRIEWFLKIFGRDNFFLEIQPDDQPEQTILNNKLFEIAKNKNIKLVAAGDCHYTSIDDHEAHETMLCIQTHAKLSDTSRFTFGKCRAYIRTEEEMSAIFKDHQDAIWNSGFIADQCSFDFPTGKLHFPEFIIPQDDTYSSYFKRISQNGFNNLIDNGFIEPQLKELYQERLNTEITLIDKMGFIGYFLVVSDFIQWAKQQNIPVGPGRGSAAGSLVAWSLQITNIDPIKYNLLFERFLNPERITMPDIDIDFCVEGRERVIEYVKNKYGHDKVCQIITFGTMMAKGVLKDAARALAIPFEDANALTDLIPDQLNITLAEAIEQEPRLREMINNNPIISHLFNIAQRLEGITRHASKHAAGVVISPEPIESVLPIYIPAKTNDIVTQYAMTELETLGYLKMDFLGLKTLTLINQTILLIKKIYTVSIDIDRIPIDDKKTFSLLCSGNTSGVFQLESNGLKEVLRKLQPQKFEDIIAVNALYRPGPLGSGMVDDFIERRHGKQKVTYIFSELQNILEETYGVIVYQEQVIKIASIIGGYSLGEADILRRAMGKKKAEVMIEQSQIFVDRAQQRGFDKKKSQELFDLMAYFAGYGFNKSHSAAYALIAYQTAYLKSQYPEEFMACLISLESTNAEKMSFYLEEAKNMAIPILPPNINKSAINFTVENKSILFGLQGIKNVGLIALEKIITERTKKAFIDILDFCTRVDLRTTNKRVIEHLIYAGAFDTLPGNRAQKISEIDKIIELAIEKKHTQLTGQMNLFSVQHNQNSDLQPIYHFQNITDLTNQEKLKKELEVVGFYLSAHPLDCYKKQFLMFNIQKISDIRNQTKTNITEQYIICAGIMKNKRIITTKKGDQMAFIQLEDYSMHAEIVIFPSLFKKIEQWITNHHIFLVKGLIDQNAFNSCKIIADEFIPIELVIKEIKKINSITLNITQNIMQPILKFINTLNHKGKSDLIIIFQENEKTLQLKTTKKLNITEEIITTFEQHNAHVTLTL